MFVFIYKNALILDKTIILKAPLWIGHDTLYIVEITRTVPLKFNYVHRLKD